MSEKKANLGLYDKYIYKDGKKFIGQIMQKKECQYEKVTNFRRKAREQYIYLHNSKQKKSKNILNLNDIPTEEFIMEDEYNFLGKNLEKNFEEININELSLNSVNKNKFIILKIVSGIYLDKKETKFLGEDANKDIINISIKNTETYFKATKFSFLYKEIFTLEKYLIIIEPNYGIFESSNSNNNYLDEIKVGSPGEIILFKDKNELNFFLEKKKLESGENYKILGNMMMKYHFEKAIYYYNLGIECNNKNKNNNNDYDNLDIILHSNLSEAYFKYEYYSKSIQNADYCLNKINALVKIKDSDTFLSQQVIKNLFRKIKSLIALIKFKEAYEILFEENNNINNNIMKDFLKVDEVKKLIPLVKEGYQNTLGKYNIMKMLKEEETNFFIKNYGEYLNPKIEINFEKDKGLKITSKEKINLGEIILVEKATAFSKHRKNDKLSPEPKEDSKVSLDNPKVIVEIELNNKLYMNLKKRPLDTEKFFYLCNGMNVNEDLNERKKYMTELDQGVKKIDLYRINQAICLNKYDAGRYILYFDETGVGIWGYASLLNHDCLYNTEHFTIGDYIFFYCIREIDKGEEITSHYVSNCKSYQERQSLLEENWRFRCQCQLCQYQAKKNDDMYNNFMVLMEKNNHDIKKSETDNFENFLQKNKKKFTCYEMANAYLKLEEHYHIIRDFAGVQRCYGLITKYADGKNYKFQLLNLFIKILNVIVSGTDRNEFFKIYNDAINYMEKYTPLNTDEIKYLFSKAFKFNV